MTEKFDAFCEAIITEILTPKNKRKDHKSRYWNTSIYPKAEPRKVRSMNNKTASQRTKLGNQQYLGKIWSSDGPRGRNNSVKDPQEIAIAQGHGSHLKMDGVNPKKVGATINSKQGEMEIKNNLPNGDSKVGKKIQRNYSKNATERKHRDRMLNNL